MRPAAAGRYEKRDSMKFDLGEHFIDAARTVLNSVHCATGEAPETGRGRKGGIVSGEVLVIAPLRGDAEGDLVLNMNTPTALRIIGKMALLYGIALTPYGLESLAELANIIIGNAMNGLRIKGIRLTTLPPFVVTPGHLPASTAHVEAWRAPLVTECGLVTVHILVAVRCMIEEEP